MNLTEKQYEILRQLVASHEAHGGEFYFTYSAAGGAITARGVSGLPCDETDLLQLREERTVTLTTVAPRQYRGKPTQLGINAVRGAGGGRGGTPVAVTGESPASRVLLDVSLISAWMREEGWTNKTLAERLKISERAISSLRNNGDYHGTDAITKVANLMGRDPDELCLPEASS